MNENGKATLVGVVSFGFECAHPTYPGIYTKIASFYHWIKSKMKRESKPMGKMKHESKPTGKMKHESKPTHKNGGSRTISHTTINPLDFWMSYFKKWSI